MFFNNKIHLSYIFSGLSLFSCCQGICNLNSWELPLVLHLFLLVPYEKKLLGDMLIAAGGNPSNYSTRT